MPELQSSLERAVFVCVTASLHQRHMLSWLPESLRQYFKAVTDTDKSKMAVA